MRFIACSNVVNQYSELVSETLIIIFITFFHNSFKWSSKREYSLLVPSNRFNGILANDLDHVPYGFD